MAAAKGGSQTQPHGWTIHYSHNALVSGPTLNGASHDSASRSDETRACFVEKVRAELEKLDSLYVGDRLHEKLIHIAMLAIINDHAISRPDTICEDMSLFANATAIDRLLRSWDMQNKADMSADGSEDLLKPARGRSEADEKAQRLVAEAWNAGRCLLSGMPLAKGVHIVPVRALNRRSPADLYKLLRTFWALPDLGPDDLVLTGRESTNILPMAATVRQSFERYQFALLPVPHEEKQSTHQLSVQIVFLDQDAKDAAGKRLPRAGFFVDSRRGHHNADTGLYESPHVCNGDIFEITTSDPTTCPLPDSRLLQIQYAVHVMMAGVRTAEALKAIFHDDPPSASGPTYDVAVPSRWRNLLEAAVDAKVLTQDESDAWGRFFRCDAIQHAIRFRYDLPGLPAEGREAWIEAMDDGDV